MPVRIDNKSTTHWEEEQPTHRSAEGMEPTTVSTEELADTDLLRVFWNDWGSGVGERTELPEVSIHHADCTCTRLGYATVDYTDISVEDCSHTVRVIGGGGYKNDCSWHIHKFSTRPVLGAVKQWNLFDSNSFPHRQEEFVLFTERGTYGLKPRGAQLYRNGWDSPIEYWAATYRQLREQDDVSPPSDVPVSPNAENAGYTVVTEKQGTVHDVVNVELLGDLSYRLHTSLGNTVDCENIKQIEGGGRHTVVIKYRGKNGVLGSQSRTTVTAKFATGVYVSETASGVKRNEPYLSVISPVEGNDCHGAPRCSAHVPVSDIEELLVKTPSGEILRDVKELKWTKGSKGGR